MIAGDGQTAAGFTDIPKSTFNISKGIGSSVLSRGNSRIKNPICYVLGTSSGSINGAGDVDSLIDRNEKADIMVVHLVLKSESMCCGEVPEVTPAMRAPSHSCLRPQTATNFCHFQFKSQLSS